MTRVLAATLRRCYSTKNPYALDLKTVGLKFDKFARSAPSSHPPIIFLHGLCGSRKNNRTSARILAKKLQTEVYNVDLKNHGTSPHIGIHDTPSMAADVERFVLDHEIQAPVIIGHSMGAKVAMAIALRRPAMPAAVIAVDNSPAENVAAAGEFEKFRKRLEYLGLISDEELAKTEHQADVKLSEVEPDKRVRDFILSNLQRVKGERIRKSKIPTDTLIRHLEEIRGWEFDPDQQWDGNALLIKATDSPFVDDTADFLRQFPRGQVKELKCGHWIITERNEDFNKICINFYRKKFLKDYKR